MKKEDAIGMGIGLTVIAGTAIFAAREFIKQEEEFKRELSAKDLVSPFWRNRIDQILEAASEKLT